MGEMIATGKITTTHGLKGQVKVLPLTDDMESFKKLKKVYITNESGFSLPVNIQSVSLVKKLAIVTFKEFDDISQVEKYKNFFLSIPEQELPQLPENSFYQYQLIGMKVFDTDNNYLGKIKKIIETGANDVFWLEDTKDNKQILIPALKEVVDELNIEKNLMVVDPPPGLIEGD